MEAERSGRNDHRRITNRIDGKIDVVEFKSKLQSHGIRRRLKTMQTTLDTLVTKTDGIDNALSLRTELIHKDVKSIQTRNSPSDSPPPSIMPSGLSDDQLATLSEAIENAVERSVSKRFDAFEQRLVSILNQENSQTPMVPSTLPLPISTSSRPTAGTIAEADLASNAPPTLVSEHQDGPTEPHDELPQSESQPTIEGPSREVAATEEDDLASPQSIPVHAPEDEGTSSGRLSQRESIPSSPTDTSTSEETDESDKSIEEDDQAGTAQSAPIIADQPAGDISPGQKSPDRKSTRLNSSHSGESRMPSSA